MHHPVQNGPVFSVLLRVKGEGLLVGPQGSLWPAPVLLPLTSFSTALLPTPGPLHLLFSQESSSFKYLPASLSSCPSQSLSFQWWLPWFCLQFKSVSHSLPCNCLHPLLFCFPLYTVSHFIIYFTYHTSLPPTRVLCVLFTAIFPLANHTNGAQHILLH